MLPTLLPLTIRKPSFLLGLAMALIASAGCGSSEGDATSTTTTSSASAETSATSTTEGVSADEVVDVTFDGSLCSLDDATEAVSGDQIFVFTNESDLPVRMKVMVLTDGKTYQDLLAIQTENGGPGSSWSGPVWLPEALISFTPVDLKVDDNQSALRYDLEPGPHAPLAFATGSPFAIWLCGLLDVTGG